MTVDKKLAELNRLDPDDNWRIELWRNSRFIAGHTVAAIEEWLRNELVRRAGSLSAVVEREKTVEQSPIKHTIYPWPSAAAHTTAEQEPDKDCKICGGSEKTGSGLPTTREEVEVLKNATAESLETLEYWKADNAQLREHITNYDIEFAKLRGRLVAAEASEETLEADLSHWQEKHTERVSEIDELREQLSAVNSHLQTAKVNLVNRNKEIADLSQELASANLKSAKWDETLQAILAMPEPPAVPYAPEENPAIILTDKLAALAVANDAATTTLQEAVRRIHKLEDRVRCLVAKKMPAAPAIDPELVERLKTFYSTHTCSMDCECDSIKEFLAACERGQKGAGRKA